MRPSSTALKWSLLPFLFACGRLGDSVAAKSNRAGSGLARSALPQMVAASPVAAKELLLPANLTPVALAGSPSGPDVALVVRDTGGANRVLVWTAGEDHTTPVAELPKGFAARAIAAHPERRTFFVSGIVGDTSQIFALANDGTGWRRKVIFKSPREIGRLIVGPRPFNTRDSVRYRIFFAAKLPDGTSSLRSITETGRVEYQVAGPKSAVVTLENENAQPGGPITASATPAAFHPRGQPLIWQDRRGCAHAVAYGDQWETDEQISAIPCGGSVSITPNGVYYLQWQEGQPGVGVIRDGHAPMA